MDFKVKGHSNYILKLKNNLVSKTSYNGDSRLHVSAIKQKQFKSDFFKSPNVIDINENGFSMEYIQGQSFSQFLTSATKRDLDNLIYRIDGYLQERIIGEMNMPIQILKDKLALLSDCEKLLPVLSNKEFVKVKVGLTHGDLTFSNMIFAEDIYLIDFLDSYIESPTIDIVKLRQDTHLYWSLNMVDEAVDLTKIKIGLNYIDNWLTDKYPVKDYELFQIINLLRIYPYTKDDKVIHYLKKNINKLCVLL